MNTGAPVVKVKSGGKPAFLTCETPAPASLISA